VSWGACSRGERVAWDVIGASGIIAKSSNRCAASSAKALQVNENVVFVAAVFGVRRSHYAVAHGWC
jgi:hypothetical protein